MSDRPKANCPVCGMGASRQTVSSNLNLEWVECTRCGRFTMHRDLRDELNRVGRFPAWHRLSAWIKEQNATLGKTPTLAESPESLLTWLPRKGVREQLDLLLRMVEERSQSYMYQVPIDLDIDGVRLWAGDREEMLFLLTAATEQGRLGQQGIGVDGLLRAWLTAQGHMHLEEVDGAPSTGRSVFLAMWFDDRMILARDEGLCAGIRAAGFEPVVVNMLQPHGDRIDARILMEIRKSRALVADATGLRPNVMFEAGFAEGLGRPVVWTVQEEDVEKLPFDTRQLLHIVWKTPDDLAKQLVPVLQHRLGRTVSRQKDNS